MTARLPNDPPDRMRLERRELPGWAEAERAARARWDLPARAWDEVARTSTLYEPERLATLPPYTPDEVARLAAISTFHRPRKVFASGAQRATARRLLRAQHRDMRLRLGPSRWRAMLDIDRACRHEGRIRRGATVTCGDCRRPVEALGPCACGGIALQCGCPRSFAQRALAHLVFGREACHGCTFAYVAKHNPAALAATAAEVRRAG